MFGEKSVSAVVLAGGGASRMGLSTNKLYIKTGGDTVIQYPLAVFASNTFVDEIVIAARPQDMELIRRVITKMDIRKPLRIVEGGITRTDSVYNAVKDSRSDIVLIHDGARPLIRDEHISLCLQAMEKHPGAIIAAEAEEEVAYVTET